MTGVDKSREIAKAQALHQFLFSSKGRVGAAVVSALLVLMAVVVVPKTASLRAFLPLAAIASFSVLATVMLWRRHNYALHAWAAVAAAIGLTGLLSSDFHKHDALYWVERVGIALILLSVACGLFKEARKMPPREST